MDIVFWSCFVRWEAQLRSWPVEWRTWGKHVSALDWGSAGTTASRKDLGLWDRIRNDLRKLNHFDHQGHRALRKKLRGARPCLPVAIGAGLGSSTFLSESDRSSKGDPELHLLIQSIPQDWALDLLYHWKPHGDSQAREQILLPWSTGAINIISQARLSEHQLFLLLHLSPRASELGSGFSLLLNLA